MNRAMLVCVAILLVGVPLIYRAWPKPQPVKELSPPCVWFGTSYGWASQTVKPQWDKKSHNYLCPEPYLVSGGWQMDTGKSYGPVICFMPVEPKPDAGAKGKE